MNSSGLGVLNDVPRKMLKAWAGLMLDTMPFRLERIPALGWRRR